MKDLADRLWAGRPSTGVFVVGVTGGVASGKSTLAVALADIIAGLPGHPRVERVGTDGFLYSNAILTSRSLLERKGYPETYDRAGLARTLGEVRSGPAVFSGYSHVMYDTDPGLSRVLDRPDVLIVEGLGLDETVALDALVYLDADRADQQSWYVSRFLDFWEIGRTDERSFYARFRDLDRDGVASLAARVWTHVNLPNLVAHIEPLRDIADLVVKKRADHSIASITERVGGPPVKVVNQTRRTGVSGHPPRRIAVFSLPDLPYAYDALSPVISPETMHFHHDKHHATYVKTTNDLLAEAKAESSSLEAVVTQASSSGNKKLFNNAGQAWNHAFFWLAMSPNREQPTGEFEQAIRSAFGDMSALKTKFVTEGAGHFGSGWVWLVADQGGALKVISTHDAADTLTEPSVTPLIVCDVWEHAYYLDHHNDRKAYLEAWFDALPNWSFAASQWDASRSKGSAWTFPAPAAA